MCHMAWTSAGPREGQLAVDSGKERLFPLKLLFFLWMLNSLEKGKWHRDISAKPNFPTVFTSEVKWCLCCIIQLRKYFLSSYKHTHPVGNIPMNPNAFPTVSELCYKPKSYFTYHTWSCSRLNFIFLRCFRLYLVCVQFCGCTLNRHMWT